MFFRKLMSDPSKSWSSDSKIMKRKSQKLLTRNRLFCINNLIGGISRKSLPSVSTKVVLLTAPACPKCSPEISTLNLTQVFGKNYRWCRKELSLENHKKLIKILWIPKRTYYRRLGKIIRARCLHSVSFCLFRCLKRDTKIVAGILQDCRKEFKSLIRK